MKLGVAVSDRILESDQYRELAMQFDYWIPRCSSYLEDLSPFQQYGKPLYAHCLLGPLSGYHRECRHVKDEFQERKLELFSERVRRIPRDLPHEGIIGVTVVNEAYTNAGKLRLGDWHQVDPEYIAHAFEQVHAVRPDLKLYLCDNRAWDKRKWEPIQAMLRYLKACRIPIHGVNLQVQLHIQPKPILHNLRTRILQIQRLGLDVMLGECSVFVEGVPGDILRSPIGSMETRLQDQADIYQQLLELGEQLGVSAIGFWSLSDEPGYGPWHWISGCRDYTGIWGEYGSMKPATDVFLKWRANHGLVAV